MSGPMVLLDAAGLQAIAGDDAGVSGWARRHAMRGWSTRRTRRVRRRSSG